jgi:hypothetical protein
MSFAQEGHRAATFAQMVDPRRRPDTSKRLRGHGAVGRAIGEPGPLHWKLKKRGEGRDFGEVNGIESKALIGTKARIFELVASGLRRRPQGGRDLRMLLRFGQRQFRAVNQQGGGRLASTGNYCAAAEPTTAPPGMQIDRDPTEELSSGVEFQWLGDRRRDHRHPGMRILCQGSSKVP